MLSDQQVFHVNCFESLKPLLLQHKNEKSLSAKVVKTERK
uniref:Uncharacterized protein n=1 Tax=Siphoviridae sp. ctBCr48 TaxID=2827802 RepID=A0A8S5SH95_9CAUD|nr:MAG TPA: hypothetical protein [Siphoviridae sp. ctBCr48]